MTKIASHPQSSTQQISSPFRQSHQGSPNLQRHQTEATHTMSEMCQRIEKMLLVRSITKPRQQGGLSHVRVPTNQTPEETQWTSVYDPQQLEDLVLDQHCKHFSQAHGTIFTQEPLCTLINDDCTSTYTQQILSGTAQIDNLPIDEYTKLFFITSKPKRLPMNSTIIHWTPGNVMSAAIGSMHMLQHCFGRFGVGSINCIMLKVFC